MYCAILGDVYDNRYKDDDIEKIENGFPFLSKYSIYSGDSVMTAAIADTLVGSLKNQNDDVVCNLEWHKAIVQTFLTGFLTIMQNRLNKVMEVLPGGFRLLDGCLIL